MVFISFPYFDLFIFFLKIGCKAIWVTVDTNVLGKREKDLRSKQETVTLTSSEKELGISRETGKGIAGIYLFFF